MAHLTGEVYRHGDFLTCILSDDKGHVEYESFYVPDESPTPFQPVADWIHLHLERTGHTLTPNSVKGWPWL